MAELREKAAALLAAYPQLKAYEGKVVVVKYGGNAMVNEALKNAVLEDIVLLRELGIRPVLSHGGGPGINRMLETLHIPVQFINGLRYTSADTMRVVEAVLIGQVNTELVGKIVALGGKAAGLSGVSGAIYQCSRRSEELGFVGDIERVDASVIRAVMDAGFIPVIAPVGVDARGQRYNINGDTAAGKLAGALGAEKLLLLTDIEGLCNSVEKRDVIRYLNIRDVPTLEARGTIAGGMIPKVACCVQAVEEGVGSVHIIDGREAHSILRLMTSDASFGTTIGTARESDGIAPEENAEGGVLSDDTIAGVSAGMGSFWLPWDDPLLAPPPAKFYP